MAEVFRIPLIWRRQPLDASRAVRSQSEQFRNLVVLTAVAAAPFVGDVLDLPRGAPFPTGLRTWAENPLTLRAPTATPPRSLQPDNPVLPQPFLRELRTFAGRSLPLLSAPLGTPVQPSVIANPNVKTIPAALYVHQSTNLAALNPVFVPFAQDDWPNPRRAARLPDYTWTRSFSLPTTEDPQQPPSTWSMVMFTKSRWVAITASDSTFGTNAALLTPTGQPFQPVDQPNPRGKPYPTALRTWAVALQTSTLQPANPQPLNQYNWPVPKGAAYPTSLRTFLLSRETAADSIYGAPGQGIPLYDWPVPKGRRPGITQFTWTQNLLQSTLRPAPPVSSGEAPHTLSIHALRIGF